MDFVSVVQYVLYGAYSMLLLIGIVLLLGQSLMGALSPAKGTASHKPSILSRVVGVTMTVILVFLLVSLVYGCYGDYKRPPHIFDMVAIAAISPFLYLITHAIRHTAYPSMRKAFAHFAPLLVLLIAYLVSRNDKLFYLAVFYVAVYYAVLLSYHSVWFLRQKDIWVNYDDAYRRQHVWQIWLIVMPVVIHALIYLYHAVVQTQMSFVFYLASGVLLWGMASLRTFFDRPTPSNEDECIEALNDYAPDETTQQPLPNTVKTQIAKGLSMAEQQQLHLKHDINLDAYAQFVGTNRSYFSRYLNQELNTTFHDYLNNKRLDHAVALMTASRMRIADVAFASGYADASTFRRNFKKYKGTPPRRYLAAFSDAARKNAATSEADTTK